MSPLSPDEFAKARASDWRVPATRAAYAEYLKHAERPRTVWRIVGVDPTRRQGLNVSLSVDTTAPAVVDAIERAAAANGITLERADEYFCGSNYCDDPACSHEHPERL